MVTNSTYQTGQNDQSSLAALPKRKAGSKLTSGHLLMILSGLATFLLVITFLGTSGKTVIVYVAKAEIPVGQQITAADFNPKEIPSSDLDKQYFNQSGFSVEGKIYAARTIQAGEPLLVNAQNTKSAQSNVRLASMPVDKKFAVNGALAKGDKIDIIETPDGCAFRALTGIEIAAVTGGTTSGGLTGGESAFGLTLALTNEGDDLILAGIINRGQFQIVRTTGVEDNSSQEIEETQCGQPPSN